MPVNLASRASAVTTDFQGKTHVVWAEGSFLWYAEYDDNSGTWKNAQAITRLENQDISNISFLYDDRLIQEGTTDNSQPGFVVTWQQGSENDSDFYYTAGKYDENQELQWLANPQAITTDQVGDLEPTALVYNGEVLLVGSKVNIENANNQQIREDSDLYYQQFTINDSFFTSPTTTPPVASYSPQISQDGVIGGLIPINESNNSVNTVTGNTGEGISTQNNSSSEPVVPEYAFAWSGGINFETTLLEVLKAKETAPAGIVQKILSPFIKEVKIQGSVKGGQNSSSSTIIGSSGDNLNPYLDVSATTVFSGQLVKKIGTLVVAPEVEGEELAEEEAQQEADKATQGKSEDEDKENSNNSSFNLSIGIDSTWTFDRDTRVLTSIFDTITLSFGVEFPVLKVPLFDLKLYADVGASFYVQGSPIEGGDYDPPLSAILEVLGVEALGTGFAALVGAVGNAISTNNDESIIKGAIVAALASAVFSTVADAIAIANNSDELDYQTAFGFPILNGGASFQLGLDALNFSGKAGIEAGLVWGIGDTPNVQFLLFPIDAGINLGPIYFGITLRPGWTWEQDNNNDTTSDVSSSLVSSTSESNNAVVQGSLLTINWGENLNPDNIPDSSQFTVTVTDSLGNITTIPVFQVSIEGNTIQLRLSQVIPLSANYDYTTSDNPTPQPSLIQVSYTTSDNPSQNLEDSQGEEIDNFNFSVTNTTPDSFGAVYNPITGNSQNYSLVNDELILSFNTPLNTNTIPDVRRFTVEGATVESVTVESNAVVLKLNENVADVSVTYNNASGLGNLLETVDNESIASFSIDSDITVSQSQFVIGVQFEQVLNSRFIPNPNQFLVQTIDNNGNVINAVTVNQVDIVNASTTLSASGNTVNLYLSQAIEDNQAYRIIYTPVNNIATDLEYQDGTEVEGFTIVSNQENSDITTNELTAIFVQNLDSNVTFTNSIDNYNVTLTDAVGNVENSVTIQSLRVKSQGVELVINHNLTDTENVAIDYENNNNSIKINSLVTGIEPPSFNTQSVIGNIEADLGQDSTPTLSLTETGEVLMAWVAEVAPIEPIAGFVTGNAITLNFVDVLGNSTSNEPSLNQFTVTDTNGNNYNITNISTVNNTVTLTLNTAVNENTELTVNYALSSGNNNSNLHLENDSTGTRLWISDFTFNLDNVTGNTNPPSLLGAGSIVEDSNSNKITLVFDQNLQGNPDNSQFIIQSNGVNYSIEPTVTVNNNTVTLSVQPPNGSNLIGIGDIVTVSYNGNSLNSIHGKVTPFNNQPVITSPTTPTTVIKYGFTPSGDALLSNLSSIIGSKGLNFNPVAGLDQNGNNVVMWVNADMSDIPTSLTPGEFYSDNQINIINESLSQSDIYYSIYNANTLQWSIASPLVSQEGSEGKIVLGMGENNQLIAAWLNYTDDETNIYWSSLAYDSQGNGIWSDPQLLYQDATPDPLTELEIANINGKTAIFWTETQQVSYSELTTEGSPILYLRLDEASGTIANNSGTWGAGGNGTYNGTVNYSQEGALENTTTNKGDKNPAVLFNNGSSLTLAEDLALISGNSFSIAQRRFTIELWFKIPNNPSETLNIASMEGLFNLSLSQSLQLNLNIDNQNISPDSPIDTDTWNYVVATYDGQSDTVILYLNGQPVVTQNNVDFTLPSTTNLTLGGGNDNLYLDEVTFYNKTLDYSDFIPSDLNSNNIPNLTGEQLISILSGDGTDIGSKYSAQYIAPLPPGPNTYYVFIDDDTNTPSQIIPDYKVTATQLSDANKPQWDIVSNVSANSNSYIYPNGIPDIFLSFNLGNQTTGTKIISIVVTAQNTNGQTVTWSVGNTQGNQLAVVQGDKLLNPVNPNGSFEYTILSPSVDLDLFLDAGSNTFPSSTNFNITTNYDTENPNTQTVQAGDVTSEPTTVNSNQVLGIATVTEANDSSLALIDSGFIINTDNASMGYILSNGDLDGDGKTDVIVGNRGYTDSDGNLLNNGTIQILFGSGTVLSDSENNSLTSTDLSGNPNGILIQGIIDGGQANSDYAMSLATGDVDGDTIDDLIIGAPNVNNGDGIVYVIKGSYLANNKGKTITIESNNSFSDASNSSNSSNNIGYVINPTVSGGYFGYSVVVGNFNGTGNADIAIGTPGANNGDGLVSIAYDGDTTATNFYSGTGKENLGYALTVSKAKGGQSFSKNTSVDDLIVGAPSFQASVANQWVGVDSFPQDNQNLFPSNTSASVGKVYVFANNNNTNPLYSFTGSILPSANGTAENSFTGSALASDDWDGDGIKDLAISAPGSDTRDGLVYLLKGGSVTSGDLDYISNLIILGGLQFGQAGSVITSAGDVNGDKYEDFLITAPQGAMGAGQGYVLFGPLNLDDTGTLFDLNVTAIDNKKTFLLNSDRSYQLVGSAASSIGDVNNDDVDDLMITAPNAQQLYAVYGHQWLADDGSIKLANISGDNGFVIDGDLYSTFTATDIPVDEQTLSSTPSLTSNNGILYLAYKGNGNSNIYLTTSSDNGQTWNSAGAQRAFAIELPSGMTTTSPPSIAFYNGVLYLAYQGVSNNDINITYSTDNGQTWSNQYQISGQTTQTTPTLVVYQGELLTLFTANNSSSSLLYVHSNNPQSNNSWSSTVIIPTQSGSGNQSSPSSLSATVLGDTLYVGYQGGTSKSPSTNYFITSTNGTNLNSLSWNVSEQTSIKATGQIGLTSDDENLYLTYRDSNNKIYVGNSTNGNNWSLFKNIPNQTTTHSPTATVLGDELIIISADTNNSIDITSSLLPYSLIGGGTITEILGDINGDGFADVFSGGSEGGVIVFGSSTKNLLDGSVSNDLIVSAFSHPLKEVIALGDYNGDGLQDFGIVDEGNNFYLQLGSNNLSSLGTLSLSNPSVTSITSSIELGDYNGDGYDDISLLDTNGVSTLYEGNSSGSVNASSTTFSRLTGNSLGDINSDGYDDIGFGNQNANIISPNILGNGQFTVYLGDNKSDSIINPPNATISAPLDNNGWSAQYFINGQTTEVAPTLVEFNGYLYMLYKATDKVNDNSNTLWMQRSVDGVNWEGLTNLGSRFETDYQPSLAVFNNTLYLAFTSTNNNVILAAAQTDSSSLGLNFNSTSTFFSVNQSSKQGPTLVAYNDRLYSFFISNDKNDNILYVSSSDPSSSGSWSTNSTVPYNGGNHASNDRIGAAVFDDKLYIAFKSSNSNDLYSTYYNGSSWASANISGSASIVSNQTTPSGPSMISGGDTLYIFYEADDDDEEILYTYGNDWSNIARIPSQSSNDRTSPAFFKQNIYVAHVGNGNDTKIYVTQSNAIFEPNQTQQLGSQLQGIGDFNGDGIEDFAVLAEGYISNLNSFGKGGVFIYYGEVDGTINSTPDVVFGTPQSTGQNLFYNLSNFTRIGDINGDGYDDIAIASPITNNNQGSIFVVLGSSDWQSTYSASNPFNLTNLNNNQSNGSNPNGFLIEGLLSSQAGISLSGGEDVNGDGLSDFTVGAPGNNDNLTYVIFGSDFNNTVNQTGTIGNDRMIGTLTGESFLGGEGFDRIYTNGGIDVVYAGLGDDFVTVHDTYFRRLDGGTGIDTLKFTGYNGQDWDLTSLSPGNRLRNFEILDIQNYGANTLTLNSLTVTQLSSTNTITVLMDENDIVNLSADFSYNDTIYQDNQTFYQYTSNQSSAKVLLNRHVEGTNTVQLLLNEEGSLVLLSESGEQLWTAEEDGQQVTGAVQALMQTDGNFVLYNTLQPVNQPGDGQFALWASNTDGNSGAYLQLGADGGLYIKNSDGEILKTFYSGNANITDFMTLSQQQDLVNNQSLIAQGEVIANVTFNAPLTNTPQSILNPETVSQVSSENSTLFAMDESGNISAVSSSLSSSDNINNAPTRISVSNPIANEADREVQFRIDRTGNLDKYVQVHYITEDRRGKAGSDYHPVLGRVVFAPGESSKTVSVVLPLDDIYTGTREFGLLVTHETESDTPLTDEFHLHVNPSDGQIRNWNHIIKDQPHSVMGGILEFRVTTTEGKGEIKLYFDGEKEFNSYHILNNETQKYEPFTFNGTTGAEFFDEDGDNKYEGVILHLSDGNKFDLDGVENGLAFKRGFFSNGETPETLLDTAIYRFGSLDTQGSYLYVGEEEKESLLTNYSNSFVEEGLAFYVSDTQEDGLIAFNRFRNSDLMGAYIYAGEEESESIRGNYPQFIDEGIAFYAYGGDSQMTDSITRFQSSTGGAYLYTGQPETENVINNYDNNFNLEGIAFEALLA